MSDRQSDFSRRFALGMSGQAFCRVAQAAYTVVLVPVLIRAWGVAGYGQWIALTALTSYLGLSNFGLVTTSANEMVIASGAKDGDRARRAFQASINFSLYIVLPVITVLVLLLCAIPVSKGLRLTLISANEAHVIIVCSGATLWLQTLRGLMAAVLYATGSYGFAYYVQGAMKWLELGGIAMLVFAFSGSPASAAVVIAVVMLTELLIIGFYARRSASWARFDFRHFEWSWLRAQAKPTLGFLLSNFSTQGLMVQGPRVVLGAILGGTAVAIYAVYGTAVRLVDQLLLMLVLPLEVEIAHSVGHDDLRRIERLIVVGTHISWAMFLLVAAGLLSFGPILFHVWTAGRIPFSYGLLGLYLCMSAANLQGRVSLHALISTNRLYGPSFLMLAGAALALGLGTLMSPVFGVSGMVLGGIIGQLASSAVVVVVVANWLGKPLREFVGEFFTFKSSWTELRIRSFRALNRLRPGV